MNWPKIITGIFLAIFAVTAIWSGVFFLEMRRDLVALRTQEALNRRRLAEAQQRLADQQRYLERLQHDPALVESIIRQKLGYVRKDEFVFRFEEIKNP